MDRPPVYPDLAPLERRATLEYLVDSVMAYAIRPSDILLVSGFWRSGTTWLMESLAHILRAKAVFEPLHPACTRALYDKWLKDKDDLFRENFMPYWDDARMGRDLESFFGKALWSAVPQVAVRQLRGRKREALRTRIVAKVVRAHLCLGGIRSTFRVPILHVRRDVRAIAASIRLTDWAWQFDRLSLRAQLLEVDDGRGAALEPWRDLILRYEGAGRLERIAAYWCVVESFVDRKLLADGSDGVVFARYEDLVLEPQKRIPALLSELGLPEISADRVAVERDSRTTSERRQGGLTAQERIFGWRDRLDLADRRRIEDVVRTFDMTGCLVEP